MSKYSKYKEKDSYPLFWCSFPFRNDPILMILGDVSVFRSGNDRSYIIILFSM